LQQQELQTTTFCLQQRCPLTPASAVPEKANTTNKQAIAAKVFIPQASLKQKIPSPLMVATTYQIRLSCQVYPCNNIFAEFEKNKELPRMVGGTR